VSRPVRSSGWLAVRGRLAVLLAAGAGAAAALLTGLSLLGAGHARAEGTVPVDQTLPRIYGIPETGVLLRATHGKWSASPTSYVYHWRRCNAAGRECKQIRGAAARTYPVAVADVGSTLRVAVTALNAAGRSKPAVSVPTKPIVSGGLHPPVNQLPPVIPGVPQVGKMLTATPGTWTESPTSFVFEWLRCTSAGTGCSSIAGAHSSAYAPDQEDLGNTLRVSVIAVNAAGESAPALSAPSEVVTSSAEVSHLEYVFTAGTVHVYSIDSGFAEVESFSLPDSAGVRGVEECPATATVYVSYGGDGGGSNGSALAYSLLTKKLLWQKSYSHGVDSFALSKDCTKLYMPLGAKDSSGEWKIVNTATGEDQGSISTPGSGGHDGTLSSDGKLLVMGEETYNHLVLYHAEAGKVQTQSPALVSGVRPNTVNGADTEVFTTASGYDGFQVSSTAEGGTIQYTENFNVGGSCSQSTCSHGISLSPDSKEVAVIDAVHKAVQFWNVEGVEKGVAPVHVATVAVNLVNSGWVQHSYDGRYVFVGDSGDVISTATHTVVAHLASLEGTRQSLEVDWEGANTVATTERVGVGH
jgi:hypothetical protein